jgi:aminoglycoside phosphotransferase (APT) family kinase protein
MALIDFAELPPALAEHLSPRARLTFPPQGKTSDVAFADDDGRLAVVKRCAHRIYLEWLRRARARANLPWCDGTAAGLAELERSRPAAVSETLIHGDLALDNVLIDEGGELHLIDWADGGRGDPRHDIALALQTKPELELSAEAHDAFFAGYGTAPLAEATRDWFVRLYDFF